LEYRKILWTLVLWVFSSEEIMRQSHPCMGLIVCLMMGCGPPGKAPLRQDLICVILKRFERKYEFTCSIISCHVLGRMFMCLSLAVNAIYNCFINLKHPNAAPIISSISPTIAPSFTKFELQVSGSNLIGGRVQIGSLSMTILEVTATSSAIHFHHLPIMPCLASDAPLQIIVSIL